jgi:uncharacterized protein (TIGR03435 family)
MAQVAHVLPRGGLSKPVIDRTGLNGRYDFVLQWSRAQDRPTADTDTASTQADPQGPYEVSLFTAMREQLGLALNPANGPVDLLVIEHVERPLPD